MSNKYNWIPFYEELANKLLEYKDKRNELFNIMKELAPKHETFNFYHFENDSWWKERNYEMDPLTIFSAFNRGTSSDNRKETLCIIANKFKIDSPIPENFSGVPLMNPQNSFFNGPNEIWNLFELAIDCSKTNTFTESFSSAFDSAIAIRNNGLATITMGLFWIRPNTYINLDRQNRELLSGSDEKLLNIIRHLPKSLKKYDPTGKEYIIILKNVQELLSSPEKTVYSIPEISDYAWENKQPYLADEIKLSNAQFIRWFPPFIQALKDLGGTGTPDKVVTKIAEIKKITPEALNETIKETNTKKIKNQICWVRNELYTSGYLQKTKRGIWALSEKGYSTPMTEELATEIFKHNSLQRSKASKEKAAMKRYWIYSPGEKAKFWDDFYEKGIMGLGWDFLNDFTNFNTKEEVRTSLRNTYDSDKSFKNDSHAIWQFTNDMKVGDVVYAKKGAYTIIGRGIIESDYIYDDSRNEFKNIRKVNWTNKGEWEHPGQAVTKALTDITPYTTYLEELERLFSNGEEVIIEEDTVNYEPYFKEDFLEDVFMTEENYLTIRNLLTRKKNIILQGAPGVGKTYLAKKLTYSIMGEIDKSRVSMIQFHQSYSYEDFIMGYRPNEDGGFKKSHGPFYEFCKKAIDDNERDYFFIIDEINRGNLSKIFGELFMLIEADKRKESNSLRLLYENEQFYIPNNVHLIGLMNTADRSLAMLDYALRRRFAFFDIEPAFESVKFGSYLDNFDCESFDRVITSIIALNNEIKNDPSLGVGFRIGHSYFCSLENHREESLEDLLSEIIEYEIIPLIQEYWFDELTKVDNWSEKLRNALK